MKRIFSLFLTLFILSACTQTPQQQEEEKIFPEVETLIIQTGGKESFQVNAEVSAEQTAHITSELRADIQRIFVKPGDTVSQGQKLIQLYSDSVQTALNTARSSLSHAQSSVYQTEESLQKNIEASKIALEKAQSFYDNLVKQNTEKRKQAKEVLESSKIGFNLSSASSETSLANSVRTLNTSIQSAITSTDEILGVSSIYEHNNDDFEKNLGALDYKSKEQAEKSLEELIQAYQNFEYNYDSAYTIGQKAENTVQYTLNMLHKTSTGTNLSESTLNSYISSITSELSSLRSGLSSLSSAKAALDQTLNKANGNSQTIINAEVQYNTTIAALDAAESDAAKQVDTARASYESAKKSAELSKTSAASSLTSASGNYSQAQINQNKLNIIAPFNGVVVDVNVKAGDEVNPGELLIHIENINRYKLTSYLTNEQVQKIRLRDTVKIGKKSSDIISAISPTVDPNTRKYKVEILHKNPFLHSGQIIPVTFFSQNILASESTILIPLISLHVEADNNFVWVIDEERKTVKKVVEIGEIIGKSISILNGLEEGDEIIIQGGRLLKKEGEKVKVKGEEEQKSKKDDESTSEQVQ